MTTEQIKDLITCLDANNQSLELLAYNSKIEQDIKNLLITMNNMQIQQLKMILLIEYNVFI
jgi:hypothetical protein